MLEKVTAKITRNFFNNLCDNFVNNFEILYFDNEILKQRFAIIKITIKVTTIITKINATLSFIKKKTRVNQKQLIKQKNNNNNNSNYNLYLFRYCVLYFKKVL